MAGDGGVAGGGVFWLNRHVSKCPEVGTGSAVQETDRWP